MAIVQVTDKDVELLAQEKRLDRRVIQGERFHPASNALWFFEPEGPCPEQGYGQWNTGRYHAHCFFTASRRLLMTKGELI